MSEQVADYQAAYAAYEQARQDISRLAGNLAAISDAFKRWWEIEWRAGGPPSPMEVPYKTLREIFMDRGPTTVAVYSETWPTADELASTIARVHSTYAAAHAAYDRLPNKQEIMPPEPPGGNRFVRH